MAKQIQLRRDTASNWTSFNPLLVEGELGIETDTKKYKLGDGVSLWADLGYAGPRGIQPPELIAELAWDEAYPSNYSEISYNIDEQIEELNIWDTPSKVIHLFKKEFTYTTGKLSQVKITRIPTGSIITKDITYSGGKVLSVSRTYTP